MALFCIVSLSGQTVNLKLIGQEMQDLMKRKQFDSALVLCDKLLDKAEKQSDIFYIISAYTNKASIYLSIDKTKAAMDLLYKALKLCKDSSENKQKAYIYNKLGSINFEQGNIAVAKEQFRAEINIRRNINDPIPLANCFINLSSIYRSLKENDSSAIYLENAAEVVRKSKDPQLTAYYYNAKAVHYHSLYRRDSLESQVDSALQNYKYSYDLWMKLGNKQEAYRPLFNLGHAYHAKKQYSKALECYKAAKAIIESLNLTREKLVLYGNMSELYYDTGDYRQSADLFRKYIEIKDSVQKAEVKSYALELDKRYETGKQSELIQKQKLELAEQELELNRQSKKVYFALFIIVLVVAIAILAFVYFNFQKKVREKTEEAKRKFFSNVVHEIRTPLSMIQAPLKVLKSKYSSEDDQYNINMAERNITRLNELVNQMLDISRIESTRYVLNETFGDLELFFSQIVSNHAKLAAEKNIILLHRFNFLNKPVLFDKDALEKITGNLLSNAIKYTPSNRQAGIDIYTEETEQGIGLTINVWDTGVGISDTDQKKIFTRFYRSSATATSTRGVGIGLSLVKDLVDLLQGSIEVKSREGSGAIFNVKLVLKESGDKMLSENIRDETSPLVLLVEDDAEILDFNANYLNRHGLAVLEARNGKEAFELIEKSLPDIIVTDLMMPEMDGVAFLKAIRKSETTNHIPVIVLSAKASSESRMEVLKLGAQAHLAKPFLPDELFAIVRNQIEILSKKKNDFKTQITAPEKKVEEKYVGNDPYTQKLFSIIFSKLDDPELSVEKLADLMATNRSHFQRKVKALTGISPSDLIRIIRLEKSKEFLLARKGNITEVAYQSGFSSQSYFTKCFTQHFGIPPTQMLQNHK